MSLLDAVVSRRVEVKLEKWGLPSVMVRELTGREKAVIQQLVHEQKDTLSMDEYHRRIAVLGLLDDKGARLTEDPDKLLDLPASVVKTIADAIMKMYGEDEEAEKN